ncbi:endonuclease [Bacteroidia bacterium]|nr:endonuclease [Bacteroidia bacterium]
MINLVKTFIFITCFSWFQINAFSSTTSYRIAFYNVENLFDYFDDTLKNDNAFTPRGMNNWTKLRYESKLKNLYKVITALNADIIGLCEIENKKVLLDLTRGTPLRNNNYGFIHYESADSRGIDVAMIYRKDRIKILESKPIHFIIPPDTISKTRDFLYAKMLLYEHNFNKLNNSANYNSYFDTLHLIICHFPSKYGGLMATKDKRMQAGKLVRSVVDSIYFNANIPQKYQNSIHSYENFLNILIMGDFNDEATDESILYGIGAICEDTLNLHNDDIINLNCFTKNSCGTHKYQDTWSFIDQIMVSSALFKGTNNLSLKTKFTTIFDASFLLMRDDKYFGVKPFRTYLGMKYQGGYSDHLPVFIDIEHL